MFDFVVETPPLAIEAPAETVWSVLTDAGRYGEWNPFTTRIETDFQPRSPARARDRHAAGRRPLHVPHDGYDGGPARPCRADAVRQVHPARGFEETASALKRRAEELHAAEVA